MKGTIRSSAGEVFARRGLVVFQFTLSIILIVSSLIIYNQVQYVQTKNLGYQKENLIIFSLEEEIWSNWDAFSQEVMAVPGVTLVSRANHGFLGRTSNTSGLNWPGQDPDALILFESFQVDYDLIETMGFELAEGRPFSRNFGADSSRIIINRTAARIMEMVEPLGKTVQLEGMDMEIIGVFDDFHYESLRNHVEPLFMILNPGNTINGFIRLNTDDVNRTLSQIEQVYKQLNPAYPFEYQFMDQQYESIYRAEMRIGELSKYFALFAIIISCLGLFGLSAFTAEQRRKEIGIRKVLGATVTQLVKMLSGSFTLLVAIALLISVPVSWWLMEQWLSNYSYRVDIEWWVFAAAGTLAVIIAWLTVSWQSVKAAMMNPVKSLKNE